MSRRLYAHCARRLAAPLAAYVFQGAVVAVCLATGCLEAATLLGTSLPVVLAIFIALALGFAAGAAPLPFPLVPPPGLTAGAVLHFGLAAWMVASAWIVEFADRAIARPGFISPGSSLWNGVSLVGLAVLLLGPPAFMAAQLAVNGSGPRRHRERRLDFIFLGAAAGLAAWGIGPGQIIGPYYCGVIVAGLGFLVALVRSLQQQGTDRDHAEPAESRASRSAEPSTAGSFREIPRAGRLVTAGCLATACGGWLAALDHLLEQLMPGTVYLAGSEAVGLCLGAAGGLWLASGRFGNRAALERAKLLSICGMAVSGVGAVALFPLGVSLALWLNAYVSSPALHMMARGAMAGLAVFPVGAAAAVCLASTSVVRGADARWKFAAWSAAAILGYGCVSAWGLERYAVEQLVVALAWCSVAAAAPQAVAAARALFAGRRQPVVVVGSLAILVVAPLWRENVDCVRSAKVLFNANAALAYRGGLSPALLMTLDDARHVATVRGERGVFTVWRLGGHQLQIRENGIPLGVVSTDAGAFPRFVPETLQAALPLVLHDKPERMLVMGLGSSESLSAALSFPVPEIVCLEGDSGLVRVLREVVAADAGIDPFDDERVTLVICDPALAMAALPGKFDVVVSSPAHLALSRSQPFLTAEFYRRAAGTLTAEGVFCQRLQFADFGPQALRTIVRTMRSAFRDVLALEVAPGELVMAATNDRRGLVRPGLIARFELPHVRALLAESGIDWSVVLNLAGADRSALDEFAAGPGASNTAAAGRLAFGLPRDVMRWSPKVQDVHDSLTAAHGRILSWVGDEAESPVLVRRLAEVQGQFELMTKYADQYWAYRASLRDQVKEKPRSHIRQVSATDDEKRLHPEDRRRLRYFEVLGQAVRTARAADIDRLSLFAAPYDPLISYFVHEEAAELYARSQDRDVAQELRHRLYATFFSSPKDASLRNVVAALTLLRENPQAEPDLGVRWDDLNALLQALKLRWEARAGVRPTNVKEAINDIDTTILAAEETFQVLEKLTAEAGLPAELWKNRRSVLEKTLIRPVKAYQLELLPHWHRRQSRVVDDTSETSAAPE